MSTVNYLTSRNSNLATFSAIQLNVSTITGSTIHTTATATTSSIVVSTLHTHSAVYSTLTGSSLSASTITSNTLALSTLTVSSINSGTPGVAAYSTLDVSSLTVVSTTTVSTLGYSTLMGSTITTNTIGYSTMSGSTINALNITLSTLTVSSINSGPPGVVAYSTLRVSTLNAASTITASTLTTTSNVGIGTALPDQRLHVFGDGARISVESNTANNAVMQMKTNANTSYLFTDQSGQLQIYPGSTSNHILLQPSGGKVGINTTAPTMALDVYMAASSDYWSHFRVKATSLWGDACTTRSETAGTQYATIMPVMLTEPHIVSNSAGNCVIRCGRAGGVTSGRWWDCGTMSDSRFCIGFEGTRTGLNIDTNGYVGINITAPAYALDVAGAANFSSRISIGGNSGGQLNINNVNGSMPYTHFNWTDGNNYIRGNTVFDTHWVSIGTTTLLFPLYIPSGRDYSWYLGAHLHLTGATLHNQSGTWSVAIWADRAIVTSYWFGTVSDRRIKKNIQPVGSMLETINKIEIVSFDFIDELNNKRDECGVIAQQIETVFPNAVDTSIGVIPCYLKFATSQYLLDDDVHILFDYDHTDSQQNIKVGDKIKINAGQNTADKGSHHVVVKSIIDGGFITEKWKEYDANDGVFLHGKEVDDFRNVDKEQLGILALKGVQELSSMVSTLQSENIQLKSQVASLSTSHANLLAWAQSQGFSG